MAIEKKEKKKKPLTNDREKAENIEQIVIDLANQGHTPSKIGIILKEKYDIAKIKLLGKKITKILKENKISYKTDLDMVSKKLSKIEKHYEKNKQDKRAKREIVRFVGLKKKIQRYQDKKAPMPQ